MGPIQAECQAEELAGQQELQVSPSPPCWTRDAGGPLPHPLQQERGPKESISEKPVQQPVWHKLKQETAASDLFL